MKLTVSTQVIKELLSRAIKGVGDNKLIPITSMICIRVGDGLELITTDATNYLYVSTEEYSGDNNFYCTIQVDKFAKLIQKMTCENIVLELTDNILNVTGNGKYKIELPLDENGNPVVFPDKLNTDYRIAKETTINKSTIDSIINTAKSALSVTMETPCYTGYYLGDNVIATDTYKICGMNIKLFDTPKLISAETMDLLQVMKEQQVSVKEVEDSDILIFDTDDCTLFSRQMAGIEDYAVDAITDLLKSNFESYCKFPKSAIIPLLDRLSLFVGVYDQGGVILTFTPHGLVVSSKAESGEEVIEYTQSENFKDFVCIVDVEMLKSQINAQVGDMVTLYYGKENAIKMVDGNVTQIIALLADE